MDVGIAIAVIISLVVILNIVNSVMNHRSKMENDPRAERRKKIQRKVDEILEDQQLNKPAPPRKRGTIADMNAKLGYDIRDEHIARERSKKKRDQDKTDKP